MARNHLDNFQSSTKSLVLKHPQIAPFIAKYAASLKNESSKFIKAKMI